MLARRLALVGFVVAAGTVLLVATSGSARADDDDAEWWLYDAGLLLSRANDANSLPFELVIDYFTTGTPPVRWADVTMPIDICTHQANRPSWLSAELFRDAVREGARMWNDAGAAVGYRYTGDCAGSRWEDGNRVNEIAFDDARNEVRFPAAAVARGTWNIRPGLREFTEVDIILHRQLNVPETCFRSVVVHELGHGLGFGHSDNPADLMYPTFNANDPSSCPTAATARELTWLVNLYGANQKPVIDPAATRTVAPSQNATLSVNARDPDGSALTYQWTQVGGPSVAFAQSGGSISFRAPSTTGTELRFHVEVFDRYMARASATVTAVVSGAAAAPAGAPSLELIGASGSGRTRLQWTSVGGATSYSFCTTPTGTTTQSCADQPSASGLVTWPTTLTTGGSATDRRVIASGTRLATLAACNAAGCSPAGAGPHIGGLRWETWQVDYDVFAMSFDIPSAGIRFTIAGVVNLEGPARRVDLYSGTATDPMQRLIMSCGNVPAGQSCIGLLGPRDGGHTSHVTVVSERNGTPTIEHRIRIR